MTAVGKDSFLLSNTYRVMGFRKRNNVCRLSIVTALNAAGAAEAEGHVPRYGFCYQNFACFFGELVGVMGFF